MERWKWIEEKNHQNVIVVSARWWNVFDIFFLTVQEHFVDEWKQQVMTYTVKQQNIRDMTPLKRASDNEKIRAF